MDIFQRSEWSLGIQLSLTAVLLYDLAKLGRFEGGYPKKPRKLVGDDTITPGRGNHRARDHPDKYCSLGEKDTRYWVHALVCHISRNLGITLHLRVPLVI